MTFHCLLWTLMLMLVSMSTPSLGSRIELTASPTNISEGVTKSFTVKCALQDDESGKAFKNVTYIIIRKAEENFLKEFARIESRQAPTKGTWAADATVQGALVNTEGYLQVTWAPPGRLQLGGYDCSAAGVDAGGKTIRLKANLDVGGNLQSNADLAKLISETKEQSNDLKLALDDLKGKVAGLRTPRYETGLVWCVDSNTWGPLYQERQTLQEVRFGAAYAQPPHVIISPVHLDVEKTLNLRYRIDFRDVTTTGFKVVCITWSDTKIFKLGVKWNSLG